MPTAWQDRPQGSERKRQLEPPNMRCGRILSSLTLLFFALGGVGRASTEEPAGSGDKATVAPVRVSDCAGLQTALAGGVEQPEVLSLSGRFACSGSEWVQEVRLARDVLVIGAEGNGVDWDGISERVVVGEGVLLRFEGTNFLVNRLEGDNRPPFLRLETAAVVSFAGAVLGARCCGRVPDDGCDAGGPSAGQFDHTYLSNVSTDDSAAQSMRSICNSVVRCGVESLEDLQTARETEQQSLGADCAPHLVPDLYGGAPVVVHSSRSKSAGATGAVLWSLLVILVVVAVSLTLGFAWARGFWRRKRTDQLRSQIIKLGPVLSCPSVSSTSGSVEDKLMGTTPKKAQSAEDPAQQRKKPRIRTGGMDVSGIRLTIPIGKGAFGKVYKGAWGGMPVAVKILKHQPDQKTAPEKDQFEADLGFSVIHPNLVHTFGSQTRKCQDLLTSRSR